MDLNAFRQAAAQEAQALGIADYELYYRSSEGTRVSVYRHEVNEFSSAVEGGVCFRCVVNGRMGYASAQELSQESARRLVRRAVDNAAALETEEPVFLGEAGQSYETVRTADFPLPEAGTLTRLALETQEALYASSPAVVDGSTAQASGERVCIAISNSKGLELRYENVVSALVACPVVAGEDGEMADHYEMRCGDLEQVDLAALASSATEKALAGLGGEPAPTGTCPVVFSPRAMASLLSTYSPSFSAERAQKGLSRLAGREGQIVGSAAVTLVDDPFSPLSAMPIPFDAEGTPAHRKNVVEGGRLNTLLYDRRAAAVAGRETTGNASKGDYDRPVEIAPFTLYLAPGDLTEEALLERAGNGVYIDSLGGLHAGANVISGDFSLQSAGSLIEDGKRTRPVRNFTVAGNFFQLLERIVAVADDLRVPYPGGITSFGSPSVLVEELSIAGK